MKLILTRHGETVENAAGIMQGHLPGKLSEVGKNQAKKLAQRLKNEKIDIIYSSDLTRAVDTAKEIAVFHKEIPLKLSQELRERNHGKEFEGKKNNQIEWNAETTARFKALDKKVIGGENWSQVYERARRFLDTLLHNHKNKTVLVVSHGGLTRALVCVIKSLPPKEIFNIEKLGNTSISIFEIEEDKNHKIILYNCNKHLAN